MKSIELTLDANSSPTILVVVMKVNSAVQSVPDLKPAAEALRKNPCHLIVHSQLDEPLDESWAYYILLLAELATHYHRQIRFVGSGAEQLGQWLESQGGVVEFKPASSVETAIDELELQYTA